MKKLNLNYLSCVIKTLRCLFGDLYSKPGLLSTVEMWETLLRDSPQGGLVEPLQHIKLKRCGYKKNGLEASVSKCKCGQTLGLLA